MSDGRSINELVLGENQHQEYHTHKVLVSLTGTFFWVITTQVSLPRIEMAVCPDPEMALNAYSNHPRRYYMLSTTALQLTNLVQTSLGGEDGQISVIGRAAHGCAWTRLDEEGDASPSM